jgi:Mrp family chromosome partitioning ATPase/capsular polysaccharide biosynthesis protein
MEPLDYLRMIRRHWRVVAACCLFAVIAAWLTTPAPPSETREYEATHVLVVDEGGDSLAPTALLVTAGEVPQRVQESLEWESSREDLVSHVEVTVDALGGSISITATADTPSDAVELANAFGDQFTAVLTEREQAQAADLQPFQDRVAELEAELNAAEGTPEEDAVLDQLADAEEELAEATEALAAAPVPTTLLRADEEDVTEASSGLSAPSSRPIRVAGGLVLGFLLGFAVILVIERFDPRLNTRMSVERAFGAPVIAEVPFVRGQRRDPAHILLVEERLSAVAESYRTARSSLLLTGAAAEPSSDEGAPNEKASGSSSSGQSRVIVVTSALPGEGKTTTAANLAAAFAEGGRSVLVLGCDFRRPAVHEYFHVRNDRGIADVITSADDRADLGDIVQSTGVPGVRIAPSGAPADELGGLAAHGRELIDRAKELADVVVIDTAPALATNEAVEVSPWADTIVLVARARLTTREAAERTAELFGRLKTSVAGLVLIGAPGPGQYGVHEYYREHGPTTGLTRLIQQWRRLRRRRRTPGQRAEETPHEDDRDGDRPPVEHGSIPVPTAASDGGEPRPAASDGPQVDSGREHDEHTHEEARPARGRR